MKKMRIIIAVMLGLLGSVTFSKAQVTEQPIYKVNKGIANQLKVNDTISVSDDKRYPYWNTKIDSSASAYYRIKNIITLRINEDTLVKMRTNFATTMVVRIYATNRVGATDSSRTDTLRVNYDTIAGANYKSRAVITFYDAYKAKVKILSVSTTRTPTTPTWNPVQFLYLENEMQIQREYNFVCTQPLPLPITISTDSMTTRGEVIASWAPVDGATEYDLEWAFVDSLASTDPELYRTAGSLDPVKIFTDNATRVTITGTQYYVPMLYDSSGIIFFRFRPVQAKTGNRRYEGNWSSDLPAGLGQYNTGRGHQPNLNWQATTSFAEEGKRKSVVQYYDGTLRARQTVTKDNSTNTTVVAETMYDYQGRPVIQVMPAPTLSRIISYTANFNRGLNSSEYDKDRYDLLASPSDYCLSPAAPMDSVSGTANYYSASNPQSSSGFNAYLPKASGYGFTEVRYVQDNSGRVLAQSGVGPDFKIGSGHETKYFYGNPDQKEIDALFGTEVGYASHYFKTMVRDANGQYSVSYTDMHGRTIATALAGKAPAGIDTLPSYRKRNITETLTDSTNNFINDLVIESSRSLLVADSGAYVFNYSLSPDSLGLNTCANTTICYDCLYNLEITITDDCNNCMLPGQVPYVVLDSNITLQPDTLCNTAPATLHPGSASFTVGLAEGNYTVTKRLSLSKRGMDYYRDSVFMEKNICKTFDDFYEEQLDIIKDKLECAPPTCDTCTARTSSIEAFRVYYMNDAALPIADTALYRDAINQAFKEALEECRVICNRDADDYYIRKMMLLDMTPPSGQYANPDSARQANSAYNIFNEINPVWNKPWIVYHSQNGDIDYVLNSAGELVTPNNLSQQEFITYFKESWAEDLLPYHPEYAKLLEYEKHNSSHLWDQQFLNVETFAQANTKGYLNPGNRSGAQLPAGILTVPAGLDPLVKPDSLLYDLGPFVYKYYTHDGPPPVEYSMWGLASVTAKCPDNTAGNNTCATQFSNSTLNNCLNTSTFCTGELDMGWRAFRELYFNAKRSQLMQKLEAMIPTHDNIPANRIEYFSETNDLVDAWGNDFNPNGNIQTAINYRYQSNCEDYAAMWFSQLKPCNLTVADSQRLIPRMVQICIAGSDVTHPLGSSTAAPGSTLPFTSFEALIKHYIDSMHTVNPTQYNYGVSCNAFLVTYPTAYDKPAALYNQPVWTKPDSCQCTRITGLEEQFQNSTWGDTSFSAFLKRTAGITISDADLQLLISMCNGNTACKFLEAPIQLPPYLQCPGTAPCAGCDSVTVWNNRFVSTFGVTPQYGDTTELQRTINLLYQNYMNAQSGFVKQYIDYLLLLDECQGNSGDTTCDSLKLVLQNFRNNYYNAHAITPSYDAQGCDISTFYFPNTVALSNGWLQRSHIFSNGVVHIPDSVYSHLTNYTSADSANVKRFDMNTARSICNIDSGFSWTTRLKANYYSGGVNGFVLLAVGLLTSSAPTGDGYYIYLAPTWGGVHRFGEGGIGLPPNASSQLGETYSDWKTVEVRFEGGYIKIYIDGQFRFQRTYAGTLQRITNLSVGFYGSDGYVDYEKVKALNGTSILNEEFDNACEQFAVLNPAYDCYKQNCQTAFTNYFNQQEGTNYTYAQIQQQFTTHCGTEAKPCQPFDNEPTLCGEPVTFPEILVTEEPPCADSSSLAFVKATELYQAYRDSLKNAFDSAYLAKCLAVWKTETFTVTHPVSEYHYTLYYYDQAGNLVKTVPPEGVDTSKQGDNIWLASVATARKNGTGGITPAHGLNTDYRYNTLNQVVTQKTPDAGLSSFWYDRLGRLILSQNSKQKAVSATETNRQYSYTKYDALGRITEVGQLFNSPLSGTANAPVADTTQDATAYTIWFNRATRNNVNISQITQTVYDIAYSGFTSPAPLSAKNLRNRVAYTTYTMGNNPARYNAATFYSYDIHGNVDTLLQDYGNSTFTEVANVMSNNNNRWKRLVYRYDLISGKVNHVAYQPQYINSSGKMVRPQDAFYHRYSYDAENRITVVETSSDSMVWMRDGRYDYYKHGPLARTVIGERQVQGVDYAYTLQGWLKGVNSTTLSTARDMGQDGLATSNNKYVAKDAYSYALHYFNNDYTAVSNLNVFAGYSANLPSGQYRPLYNGNISSMAVNIGKLNSANNGGDSALLYNYKYDQLNRIKEMDAYRGLDTLTNTWSKTTMSAALNQYKERISYDANGNILKYLRHGNLTATPVMDSLSYKYTYVSGKLQHNKLNRVWDNVPAATYSMDIDSQLVNNYVYDSIGNLIKDVSEGIDTIKWNVYGKITEIIRNAPTTQKPVKKITYGYDAAGNRISKKVEKSTTTAVDYTWYVRDASGNVMSTYTYTSTNATDITANKLRQNEVYLYGSSRLGSLTLTRDVEVSRQTEEFVYGFANGIDSAYRVVWKTGLKQYELSNHLGNVLVTISDKKFPVAPNNVNILGYTADVVTAGDFYPFGMQMPGRRFSQTNKSYRYGFNGKENDNEIKGEGNQLDYGARIYDPRLGRWLSTDPLTAEYAWQSPYAYHKNSPIVSIDWQGKGDPPYEKNNVHFVPLHDPFVAIFLRQDDVTFTSTAIKVATKDVATYSINMQQYESTSLRARANYGTGAGPYSNSDYRAIGYAVADGKVVSGRSSPQTFYFAQDAKTKKWSAGQGDAPTNSAVAFGGGIPIIINGLAYGEKNVYSSGAPADLPTTGDPGAGNSKYLLQRSNSGYTQQNNKSLGKSIVAFNSKTSDFLIITQEDGIQGMSLDEIRDYVKGLGFDNALSFDGSTSATLVSNYSTIRQGGYTPQTIVAPTSRKDNSIPVGATFADVNAKETDKKQNK